MAENGVLVTTSSPTTPTATNTAVAPQIDSAAVSGVAIDPAEQPAGQPQARASPHRVGHAGDEVEPTEQRAGQISARPTAMRPTSGLGRPTTTSSPNQVRSTGTT
jgi:hypothetical protein